MERGWVALLALLPIVTSWVRSGRGFEERWLLAVWGLMTAMGACWLCRRSVALAAPCRSLWRDPVLYMALVFMGLLLIQWFNSGRELVFNEAAWEWEYGPPPHPGWPSSFDAGEASQMLCWFFPAWVTLLVIRCRTWSRKTLQTLMFVLLVNAGFLSVFGIIQFLSGTTQQFWFHPLPGYFFSSFGYPNHAASFFVLSSSLGWGLFLQGLKERERGFRVWVALVCALLCFAGALLSLSRTGIAMAFVVLAVVLLYGGLRLFRRGTPVQRLNVGLGALALLVLVLWTMYSVAGSRIVHEVKRTYEELSITRLVDPPERSLTGIRYPFWKAAIAISRDYPLYGCGGWGFRYLRKLYIPRETWKTSKGYANVHNDPLNFLVEYGWIGAGCMLGTVLLFAVPLGRSLRHPGRKPLLLFITLGLGCVGAHSIIDLPFRCPAILYYWLILLALAGEGGRQRIWSVHKGYDHDGKQGRRD